MNELLSICIPTFNRCEYLNQCLENIIPQAEKFMVPIYISDNNSTDNTESTVELFKQKYENIYYLKQESNIGLDRNMHFVLSMSKTKYSWWLGDDDQIFQDSIEQLLNLLKYNEYSLVLLNANIISNDLKVIFEKKTMQQHENIIFKNCVEFFIEHWLHMPFGTIVVNTRMINYSISERFIGTSHAYSGAIMDYLAKTS